MVPVRKVETERLVLETLRPSRAAELFDELNDPEVYKYIDEQMPADLQSLTKRYEALRSTGPEGGSELWLNWGQITRFRRAMTPGKRRKQKSEAVLAEKGAASMLR